MYTPTARERHGDSSLRSAPRLRAASGAAAVIWSSSAAAASASRVCFLVPRQAARAWDAWMFGVRDGATPEAVWRAKRFTCFALRWAR
jgi:hypothetical protein